MLKYYLRGLGIGIIVTTLVLSIVFKFNGRITDSEIKERASKLGMIMPGTAEDSIFVTTGADKNTESGVNATTAPNNETTTDKPTENVTTKDPATEAAGQPVTEPPTEPPTEPATEPPTEPATEPPTEPATEPPTEPATEPPTEPATKPSQTGVTATIEIVSGMYSEAVCKILVEKGIISNGGEFNDYMENHGFAERICTGKFTVSSDMSYEQIARIITRS